MNPTLPNEIDEKTYHQIGSFGAVTQLASIISILEHHKHLKPTYTVEELVDYFKGIIEELR